MFTCGFDGQLEFLAKCDKESCKTANISEENAVPAISFEEFKESFLIDSKENDQDSDNILIVGLHHPDIPIFPMIETKTIYQNTTPPTKTIIKYRDAPSSSIPFSKEYKEPQQPPQKKKKLSSL
eukprot:346922_1